VCGYGSKNVEQCVLLYESYVKCGSARKCRRKFPGITVLSIVVHPKTLIRSGLLVHSWTRNLLKRSMLTKEKPDEIQVRLEHIPPVLEVEKKRKRDGFRKEKKEKKRHSRNL
jgi:hypothetical protein